MSDHTTHSTPARDDSPLALLLDPLPHDEPADADLAALLLALVSPASPDDLVGREAALATFAARTADQGPPRQAIGRAGPPRAGTVRRLLAVPAVAVVTGGV